MANPSGDGGGSGVAEKRGAMTFFHLVADIGNP
jgi:hypothetical protein